MTSPALPTRLFDALARGEQDPIVRDLASALGEEPVEALERSIGVPPIRSKHLRFASGGELVFHDGALAAVLLHLVPTPFAPRGLRLQDWFPDLDKDSDLDRFKAVFGPSWRFAGGGSRYFPVTDGFVRLTVRSGILVGVVVSAEDPKLICRPEDETCETCADLPVLRPDDSLDVTATIEVLRAAVADGRLREDSSRIPLADLALLHDSGLGAPAEGQVSCRSCERALCLGLRRDAEPILAYLPFDVAWRRPAPEIPPVALWGDAARIAAERDAMRYVDHEPGRWFLVARNGETFLDVRTSAGPVGDTSVLIRLDADELAAYASGEHEALSELAERIDRSAPTAEGSPYRVRDLYRGPEAPGLRAAVSAAIVDRTWIAEQRRAR
ncbi:hypothetical protein BMH32_00095 [Leucobacter sp. OLJS4]|uniref:hypothetical protein n=1 Tax=unclassified Leucobacter TaxID=2621730 RepID=UPI000C17FE54|nr:MULTISPECIES: hypothetical protein [unclassified Leucobacter]PII81472.1 hypothetical protein BMH25_13110 [Leucobacter sp. OLCALW19]PII86142.1 hypothetical protein BMH26_13530 [Leucobacter sp. OLTLW20]PII90037.1 hypothetical protein BMH27_11695 [Leucobacter sp. OLAS13]PII97070.1 hypothetical protein BMH29_12380 [Leucobacter sp. OLDS2]PIJ02236.1 hypothetical protein BMH31_12500 [Leucobacter sp. OLIS6]